jgi:hypothetical protein
MDSGPGYSVGAVFDVKNPRKVGRRPRRSLGIRRDRRRLPIRTDSGGTGPDCEQSRKGTINRRRDGGHTGKPGRAERELGPDERPAALPRRMKEDLGGEQSPWKDRTSTRGNEGDVTDSSAEQGPEAGRPAGSHPVRHFGNEVMRRSRTRHRLGRHVLQRPPRCFGTADGTRSRR